MALTVKRQGPNDNTGKLIFDFVRLVRWSGIIKETRKRRFHTRPESKRSRRAGAIHRDGRRRDRERAEKLGKTA